MSIYAAQQPLDKPCPFCGGKGAVFYDSGNEVWPQRWLARCEDTKECGAIMPGVFGSSSWRMDKDEDQKAFDQVVAKWERRAAP